MVNKFRKHFKHRFQIIPFAGRYWRKIMGKKNSLDFKLDSLIAAKLDRDRNVSSDGEDDEPVHAFADDMASEGEEDTPSEGSNDIVERGESLHSSDTDLDENDEDSTNSEMDSFIAEDESVELLSGKEYDLDDSAINGTLKGKKRKSRILVFDDSSDDECNKPLKQCKSENSEVVPDMHLSNNVTPTPASKQIVILQDIVIKPSKKARSAKKKISPAAYLEIIKSIADTKKSVQKNSKQNVIVDECDNNSVPQNILPLNEFRSLRKPKEVQQKSDTDSTFQDRKTLLLENSHIETNKRKHIKSRSGVWKAKFEPKHLKPDCCMYKHETSSEWKIELVKTKRKKLY